MTTMDESEIYPLSAHAHFHFQCGPEVSCFNACCGNLTQYLSPYDILRLKKNLGVSSSVFLASYTQRHDGPRSGLPVVTLRPRSESEATCPFVTPRGCRVYEDRPASCRMYPIMRMAARDRETGNIREEFMLIREPHCRGFSTDRKVSVSAWMEEQGLLPYNAANDDFLRILAVKRDKYPGMLPTDMSDRIYTALYDSDRFAGAMKNTASAEEDEAFLHAAYDYVIGCL